MKIKIPAWLLDVAEITVIFLIAVAIVSLILKNPIIRRATPKEMIEQQNVAWKQYLDIKEYIKEEGGL